MTDHLDQLTSAIQKLVALNLNPAETKAYLQGYLQGFQDRGAMSSTQIPKPVPALALPSTTPSSRPRSPSTLRGLRAQTLRLLYTGPCSRQTLSKELGVQSLPLHRVLGQLRREDLICAQPPNRDVYQLTAKGRPEAQWYVDHPTMKLKLPSKDKA